MFVSEVTYINTFIIILFIFMYLCICVFTQMIIFLQHIFNAWKSVHGFNNLLNVNAVSKRTRESLACGTQPCDAVGEHALC